MRQEVRYCEILWDLVRQCEIPWDSVRLVEIPWDSARLGEIPWDFVRLTGYSWVSWESWASPPWLRQSHWSRHRGATARHETWSFRTWIHVRSIQQSLASVWLQYPSLSQLRYRYPTEQKNKNLYTTVSFEITEKSIQYQFGSWWNYCSHLGLVWIS